MNSVRWLLTVFGVCFLLAHASGAMAGPVIANGSFETGDYTGWVILQGAGSLPEDGTWGIAQNGQTVNRSENVFDYFDQIQVSEKSSGLPITYQAGDGTYLAIQLQNGGQDHRLFQDVSLPANAVSLSWDMFYINHDRAFSPNQYLAVHIRDLDDNILATLFVTDDVSPLSMPMSNLVFDISSYAGTTVRIDVELKVHTNYLDAAFDNFNVVLAVEDETPSELAPPGWSRGKGKKLAWAERKATNTPKGFEQGNKSGWGK
jgi:hypothetical protein